jgi:putative methionine-R-sulfoxide reductase with GAF domain
MESKARGTDENIGVGRGGVNHSAAAPEGGLWRFGNRAAKPRCEGLKAFTIMRPLPEDPRDAAERVPAQPQRREPGLKPFSGLDRRRSGSTRLDMAEGKEVTVFHELGKALTSSLQLDQVLRTIMEKINEVLRPDTWSLLLMDLEKNELYFQIATGKGTEALKDVRIKLGQGLAGWVAQTGEAVVVPDTTKDSRFFPQLDERTKVETRSIVAVPVRFRDHCLGVIELINCIGPEGFSHRDLALLEALADYAAIAIDTETKPPDILCKKVPLADDKWEPGLLVGP